MAADCQSNAMEEPRLETESEQRSGEGKKTNRTDRRSKTKTKVDAVIDISSCFHHNSRNYTKLMEMFIAKYTPLCSSGASWAP